MVVLEQVLFGVALLLVLVATSVPRVRRNHMASGYLVLAGIWTTALGCILLLVNWAING